MIGIDTEVDTAEFEAREYTFGLLIVQRVVVLGASRATRECQFVVLHLAVACHGIHPVVERTLQNRHRAISVCRVGWIVRIHTCIANGCALIFKKLLGVHHSVVVVVGQL